MKKGLLNLGVGVMAIIALRCETIAATPLSWAESYGVGSYGGDRIPTSDPFYGSGFDFPVAMANMPDGGYVVAGQLDLPELYAPAPGPGNHTSGNAMGTLARFAPDGSIVWQRVLRQTNDRTDQFGTFFPAVSRLYQVVTDTQGNIFVCGGKGNTFNSVLAPFVAKFSATGNLIWENGFQKVVGTAGAPPQSFESITGPAIYMGLTNEDGVIVSFDRPNQGYMPSSLAKFNSDGSMAFYSAYDNASSFYGGGPVAQSTDGSRYIMAIRYPLENNQFGPVNGTLLLISDANGTLIAQRGWKSLDGGNETPVALIPTADGGFASMSVKDDFAGLVVRKYNSDASATTLEKVIGSVAGVPRFVANSLVETADGGFLIGGHTRHLSSGNEDAALMKLRTDGTLEFVSVVGGPANEGGDYSNGPSTAFATTATDGGYALACTTMSYKTGPVAKPDWWIVKTDANRHVRNFQGTMLDQAVSSYNITGAVQSPLTISDFHAPNYSYGPVLTTQPLFIIQDLSLKLGIDLPSFVIQASSPRIVSSRATEAVVQQHFSYHTITAFFPDPSTVTFSATGLPQGFVINATTGVISGVAPAGSETVETNLPPIPVVLHATDGTDTADATINLAISDGAPLFSVNGSDQPAYPSPAATPVPDLADKVLSFTAQHPGALAGRIMNVEATTTPENGASWQRLQNGSNGYMTYEPATGRYVLNSTSYPQQNGVYFRSKLAVSGHPDSISNVVGPFNLGSGSTRAGQPLFSIIRNGIRADFDFQAIELSAPADVALRVQSSTTPSSEGSWIDLPDSNAGAMTAEEGNLYSHISNNIPAANGVYFRAVAKASGFIDSLSNIIGPYNLITDNPPQVTLTRPAGGIGSGTQDDPAVFTADQTGTLNLHISGSVVSDRLIKNLSILVDGSPVETVVNGATTISVDYATTRFGDRVIEVLATDDLGATARAGTGPLFVRIVSAGDATINGVSTLNSNATQNSGSSGKLYRLVVDRGGWSDPNTWMDTHGNHGVPGPDDTAIVGDGLGVTFTLDVAVKVLSISGGQLIGPGILTITQNMTVTRGAIQGDMYLDIGTDAVVQMLNDTDFDLRGTVTNRGKWCMRGRGSLIGVRAFFNRGISDFQMPLLDPVVVAAGLSASPRVLSTQSFENSGKITVSGFIGNNASIISTNGGGIVATGGGNLVNKNGGTIVATGGGNIVATGGGNLVQQGSLLIGNDGAGIVATGGGNIVATGGGNIVATGGGNIVATGGGNRGEREASLAASETQTVGSSGFVQTAGETDLNYVTITGGVDLQGGVLNGSGIIDNLTVTGGYFMPGHSAGLVTVTGDYTQTSGGTLILEAAGGEAGQFDQVQVGGSASLDGKLILHSIGGYVPLPNDPFNPLGYDFVSGSFASVTDNVQVAVNPTGLILVLDSAKPNPPAPTLLNISTRAHVETGDDVAIGGFIISGSGSKHVIIRAIGPSLSNQGVPDALANPTLELHDSNGTLTFNDDWKDAQQSEIEATGLAPTNDSESAIVATLAPGPYTAIVRGKDAGTGIGLVEVYDLDSGAPVTPANISTRGKVGIDDNVMIGGFILGGNEPTKVLVRAVGPSLVAYGIPDVLADPTLELHDASGAIITNDDWRDIQEADINATNLPPIDNKESAILAILPPGAYTAIVRGKNGATGVALVEVYRLQ